MKAEVLSIVRHVYTKRCETSMDLIKAALFIFGIHSLFVLVPCLSSSTQESNITSPSSTISSISTTTSTVGSSSAVTSSSTSTVAPSSASSTTPSTASTASTISSPSASSPSSQFTSDNSSIDSSTPLSATTNGSINTIDETNDNDATTADPDYMHDEADTETTTTAASIITTEVNAASSGNETNGTQTKPTVDTTIMEKPTDSGGTSEDLTVAPVSSSSKAPNTSLHPSTTQPPGSTTVAEKTTPKNTGGEGVVGCGSCSQKMFSEDGLIAFIGVVCLCLLLMVLMLLMILKLTARRRNRRALREEEKNIPKLKMLEIRDPGARSPDAGGKPGASDDGLQTFSLDYDYEKHVRDRIEEHKRKAAKPKAEEPVSTFLLGKKPSLLSSSSGKSNSLPTSPASTLSPGETTPLNQDHDPNVFNFTRTPGESLVTRRASNFEGKDRRRSNASSGKGGKTMVSRDDDLHPNFDQV